MSQSSQPSQIPSLLFRLFALLAVLAGLAWQQRPDGRLHILFPALAGDAIIVQTPSGDFILIDGGAEPAALTAALGRAMPFWKRDLALVVLSSADSRHLPGQIAALARYRVGRALAPAEALGKRSALMREWQRLLQEQHVPAEQLHTGQKIALSGGAVLRVLTNDMGLILRIEYGRTAAVLAHSVAPDADLAMQPAQLVVFPWEYDPRIALVQQLQAQTIVYSDGAQADDPVQLSMHDRRVGHAAQYHEALHGTIVWVSDGKKCLITKKE